MRIENATPLASQVVVSDHPSLPVRVGQLVVKATYRLGRGGRPELDRDGAMACLSRDLATPLGLLPSDLTLGPTEAFQVILLGAAYGGHTGVTTVRLSVGRARRDLRVFGDRRWRQGPGGPTLTEPESFERMPLTWDRAFGGTGRVWLQEGDPVVTNDVRNPDGCGLDVQAWARDLQRSVGAAPGFPRRDPDVPRVPNLEDPARLLRTPDDAPDPCCWATVPRLAGLPLVRAAREGQTDEAAVVRALDLRAHPDWVIPAPEPGAWVELLGATRGGRWAFPLPSTRVVADYALGGRVGCRAVPACMLVLLPDEGRFYVVHRLHFSFPASDAGTGTFRLRQEEVRPLYRPGRVAA